MHRPPKEDGQSRPDPPPGFWGKLAGSPGSLTGWLSLEDHCADVAACSEALLQRTLLGKRLAAAADLVDLEPVQVTRLAVLAAWHDLGKYNLGFQNKALPKPPFVAGHLRELVVLFGDDGYRATAQLCEVLPLAELASWSEPGTESALRLLLASLSHHGRPIPIRGSHDPRHWQPARGLEPFSGIRGLVQAARRWFPDAFAEGGPPLPSSVAFQHLWCGLVTLADWLGSDSQRFFPFETPTGSERIVVAREWARRALIAVGLDPAPARTVLRATPITFSRLAEVTPRPAQQAMLDLTVPSNGSLAILEAETGSGKTEAALARYLTLFGAGAVDGLYFALPTRAAASQLHRRVYAAICRAIPELTARPPVVLAVPGYLAFDDAVGSREDAAGAPLPPFTVLWNDDGHEAARFRGWAAEHSKRYLAGPVVVGTVDQALLAALAVSHAHLRSTALARCLLVVDEVHASDPYMTQLLRAVLDTHLRAGGHAVLMSATLGSDSRRRLAESTGRSSEGLTATEASTLPYPRLTLYPRGGEPEEVALPQATTHREVDVEIAAIQSEPAEIARRAHAAARCGARVLVLRNTVSGCLEVQSALETQLANTEAAHLAFRCQGLAAPHHSRFSSEDRRLLDQAIERAFGKESQDAVVAITTQTVEQSLDIDADLLLTDLCPMDVLLQRIGRLHRHRNRQRPAVWARARVVVLMPTERNLSSLIRRGGEARGPHGLGTVYSDLRVLEATWCELEHRQLLRIPSCCREVVEAATHPQALAEVTARLGGAWHDHQNHILGIAAHDRAHAKVNLLDRTVPFGEAAFPDREMQRKLSTRLGEEDRLAVFDPPWQSPFGTQVRALRLPAALNLRPADGVLPHVEASGPEQTVFSLGGDRLFYDRLGLRKLVDNDPSLEAEEATE